MIMPAGDSAMNNSRLGKLLEQWCTEVDGRPGQWKFSFDDVEMFCLTDEHHDRMRVIAPIAPLEGQPDGLFLACLQANYDRALDARYCIDDDMIWGAFLHPLGSLTDSLLHSALKQVAAISKNFGTSFSSGELVFTL